MYFDVLIKGGWLLTDENNYTAEKVWIGIKDGRIAEISHRSVTDSSAAEVIDAEDCVVMPGMVNGHCHGDMACAMGFGDGLTLDEQNHTFEKYDFLKKFLSDDDRVIARKKSYLDALCGGVTFICENMYWGMGLKSVEALAGSGIRGALAEDIRVSFLEPEVFVPDAWLHEFVSACRKNDLVPLLGTVSEEDFDTALLQKIYRKRDELGLRNTQHYAETDWREEIVLKKFGMRPVEYLYKNGFLSENLIGSHCVHVNDAEVAMMAECGTHVINTPQCEMKIADGAAPLTEYVRAGVNVGLGTDGAEWSNSSDLFREMKTVVLLQSLIHQDPRALSERDVLRMATIGGARAFGVEDKIGSIAPGKEADCVILDMSKTHLQPLRGSVKENVASTVVFNAVASDVRDVLVKGKIQLRRGVPTTVNREEILKNARDLSERLFRDVEAFDKTE